MKQFKLCLLYSSFLVVTLEAQDIAYVCPPCDLYCDTIIFDAPGKCPHCQMTLIPYVTKKVDSVDIHLGADHFVISGAAGSDKTIEVHYYMPDDFDVDTRVIIVLPGAGRNGNDYRDAWIEAANTFNVLILSPSYSNVHYPGFWNYNLAGMIRDVNPENETYSFVEDSSKWIYSDFDRIFNLVKDELSLTTERYDMFGHSAGGQILHRMAIFYPNTKVNNILASNSGWYTCADETATFPYGLKNTNRTLGSMTFESPLVLFLGEKDDASESRGHLRTTDEANLQGSHRLARGNYFFSQANNNATELSKPFSWSLITVPNVGHDYRAMSKAAAEYLYAE